MVIFFVILGIVLLFLFFYPILKVSSECSREEEKREMLWLQQEYGKSRKD